MEENYNVEEAALTDVDAKSEEITEIDSDGDDAVNEAELTEAGGVTDYEAIIASDIATLKSEFPELKDITEITELNNPLRYAALRDLGLSPVEAYMATARRQAQDTRSHLRSAHGRSAAAPTSMMTQYELATARELFPGLNDSDLQRLYKKVTK